MNDYVPDKFSRSFGGMITHDHPASRGFECLVYDLGPNVIACGEGVTPEEARRNVKKVRWGYALRLDFLFGIPEEKRQEIGSFLRTLTSAQKELICDMLEETRRQATR